MLYTCQIMSCPLLIFDIERPTPDLGLYYGPHDFTGPTNSECRSAIKKKKKKNKTLAFRGVRLKNFKLFYRLFFFFLLTHPIIP